MTQNSLLRSSCKTQKIHLVRKSSADLVILNEILPEKKRPPRFRPSCSCKTDLTDSSCTIRRDVKKQQHKKKAEHVSSFLLGGQPAPVATLATQISARKPTGPGFSGAAAACKTGKLQRLGNVKRPEEAKVGHGGEDLQRLSGRKTKVV